MLIVITGVVVVFVIVASPLADVTEDTVPLPEPAVKYSHSPAVSFQRIDFPSSPAAGIAKSFVTSFASE